MADYSNGGVQDYGSSTNSATYELGKIFLYMFIAILGTAVVAGGVGYLFYNILLESDHQTLVSDGGVWTGVMIGAGIAVIAMFVSSMLAGCFSFGNSKPNSHSVLAPFIIYAVAVGYLFGFIVLFCPWEALAVSLGVTVIVYGVLALIGLFAKGNLNALIMVSSAMVSGCLLILLMNWLLIWLIPGLGTATFWIVTFVIFAAIMLSTIWDVWNINKITKSQEMTPNLSLYLAYRLYCDFIALFVRVLFFVLIIFSKNKN